MIGFPIEENGKMKKEMFDLFAELYFINRKLLRKLEDKSKKKKRI